MTNLLTLNEAAARLSIHPETLRRWIRDNKITAIKFGQRSFRFREEHLEGWINKRTVHKKAAASDKATA